MENEVIENEAIDDQNYETETEEFKSDDGKSGFLVGAVLTLAATAAVIGIAKIGKKIKVAIKAKKDNSVEAEDSNDDNNDEELDETVPE